MEYYLTKTGGVAKKQIIVDGEFKKSNGKPDAEGDSVHGSGNPSSKNKWDHPIFPDRLDMRNRCVLFEIIGEE